MRIGTAWQEITPDRPLTLLGQMNVRVAERTRDPLTVNAVVFEDGGKRVAIVSADLCMIPDETIRQHQAACESAHGIPADSVIIAATHTHVGPCTIHGLPGEVDDRFMADLQQAIVNVVGKAIDDLEEADLHAGAGYLEQMGWNRRGLRRDGSCHMYWGSWKDDFVGLEGPRDGQVGVIFARRKEKDGSIKAVLSSFATHPNCLEAEKFYSADLPGEVRKVLRGTLGQDIGVVYLTGAAGDTAPSNLENNPQAKHPWRGELGVKRSGWYLGGEILKVIANAVEPMKDQSLRHEHATVPIPIRPWDSAGDMSQYKGGMLEFFQKSQADWPRMLREESPVPVRLNVVRLGEAAICFNPAELYCAFGLAIKKSSPAKVTLISELSDGYIGYVPTPQAARHGGYSAMSASGTKLIVEGGWIMVEETGKLLQRAFAKSEASAPATTR